MNHHRPLTDAPWRNIYGRRRGKKLRPAQKAYLDEDLKTLGLKGVSREENPERAHIDLGKAFGWEGESWLEIGFGAGEHMVHQALGNPEVRMVGCEHYVNGVAAALGKIRREGAENIRIYPGDARDLFDVAGDGVFQRVFLLYPDPWPKRSHHKRRFVTPEFLDPLSRLMGKSASLRVATDIPDYARQTLEQMAARRDFEWTAESCADWRIPWTDWLPTRYERKAIREGRTPCYLEFRKA